MEKEISRKLKNMQTNFFLKIVGRYYGAGQIFEMDPERKIHWPGTGKPPLDVPECGFLNESCNTGANDTSVQTFT